MGANHPLGSSADQVPRTDGNSAERRTRGPASHLGLALLSKRPVHPLHFPYLAKQIVVCPTGCWIWGGELSPKGYGIVKVHKRRWNVHRLIYWIVNGPVAADLTVDHLCRIKACVNPKHLEAVTRKENVLRAAPYAHRVNGRFARPPHPPSPAQAPTV